jgi:Fic family protein
MKMPQKPKDFNSLFKENNREILNLLENKEVMKFVEKCNHEYLHWDELRHRKMPNDASPESVWALMKLFRRQRYKKLGFSTIEFRYSLIDETLRKLHILDKGCAGRLETGFELANLEGKEKYIISSLMEEAIATSQIEGAATTRKIAKEILRMNRKPRNYSEQMIVNGYRTIQKIAKMRSVKLTPEFILELHSDITKDALKDKSDEGKFRETNEIIVGDAIDPTNVYHVPPDYRKIPELIQEFCAFANEEQDEFMHPVIKGILLHFLMGYIHPFNDGNGRVARAIFYWYVLSRGYWLFEFMSISRIILRSKVKYGMSYLYTETDENDLTYFVKFNLDAIEEALHDMEEYINRKQKEQAEAMKMVQEIKNINMRQADILKKLMKNPERAVVISEIMNTYDVAYDTARNDLLHLAKLGYLEKMQFKRKFVFRLAKKNGL